MTLKLLIQNIFKLEVKRVSNSFYKLLESFILQKGKYGLQPMLLKKIK